MIYLLYFFFRYTKRVTLRQLTLEIVFFLFCFFPLSGLIKFHQELAPHKAKFIIYWPTKRAKKKNKNQFRNFSSCKSNHVWLIGASAIIRSSWRWIIHIDCFPRVNLARHVPWTPLILILFLIDHFACSRVVSGQSPRGFTDREIVDLEKNWPNYFIMDMMLIWVSKELGAKFDLDTDKGNALRRWIKV